MDFDLVVVGGGLAGASLAVALRRTALRIALVEAHEPRRTEGWDNRVYAISPANRRFLADAGIWQHLDADRLNPVTEMAVFGDAGGALRFSAYESGLGELAWIAESSLIQRELWESLKRQHNVRLFCPAKALALDLGQTGATLTLGDGHVLRSRLVVAADGAKSWVREQAGIQARVSAYEEIGVVANFRCSLPHRNIAYQWFREDGILAWLPLPGNRISIVWSAPEEHARRLLALDPDELASTVAEAGSMLLGALELESQATGFPLHLMRVDDTVRPRLVLIGDAAHTIHPLSGHGINLGLQDARALAARLEALPEWRDPGDIAVLRAYARERAEEPMLLQYATHALNRLFSSRNPLVSRLRNTGMNLTGHLPVVQGALVRYAVSGRF